MVIDHIGATDFPHIVWLRVIGRIAFPIFSYQLAQGYVHTSNLRKYYFRLLGFAIYSQFPYMLLFQAIELNILFSLFLGLLLIEKVDKRDFKWIPLIILIAYVLPLTYGVFGVVLPCLFYGFRDAKKTAGFVQNLAMVMYTITIHWPYQLAAGIGSILAIYWPSAKFQLRLNKYFFYWFYPAHLGILFLVKIILLRMTGQLA